MKRFLFVPTMGCASSWMAISLMGLLFFVGSLPWATSGPFLQDLFHQKVSSDQLTVVFDLGGVLIDTNRKAAMRELGTGNLIACALKGGNVSANLKNRLYDVLDCVGTYKNEIGARDDEGRLLPGLMCAWMTGKQAVASLREQVCGAIENHSSWFSGRSERYAHRNITCKIAIYSV